MKDVDCITCHNRVSHSITTPEESVDMALYAGVISGDIPYLRQKAVELLSAVYSDSNDALKTFADWTSTISSLTPRCMGKRRD